MTNQATSFTKLPPENHIEIPSPGDGARMLIVLKWEHKYIDAFREWLKLTVDQKAYVVIAHKRLLASR